MRRRLRRMLWNDCLRSAPSINAQAQSFLNSIGSLASDIDAFPRALRAQTPTVCSIGSKDGALAAGGQQ